LAFSYRKFTIKIFSRIYRINTIIEKEDVAMFDQILQLSKFMADSFLHIWPYLVVTIPLAVTVNMSGVSKYIKNAFQARPLTAILLATIAGAFSPFCSCGVIPIIASLLISGVPLAPVMSFWIASPSMDPEIFFLSVGMIGWELAVWRLTATLVLSLGAGLMTQWVMERGWLGQQVLRSQKIASVHNTATLLKEGWQRLKSSLDAMQSTKYATPVDSTPICVACSANLTFIKNQQIKANTTVGPVTSREGCSSQAHSSDCGAASENFLTRLLKETLGATWMVAKFMALAFLLEGLITLYIPQEWISAALGHENPLAIIAAAGLGVPVYTSSLTALPMMSGLLTQGMTPAAALAFLWPLVARPVFVLYVSFSLFGAVLVGYLYKVFMFLH
jgi:uncharacterized membrane protein YraQ (UPF0718 family)